MQSHYARRLVPVVLTIVATFAFLVFFSPRASLAASAHTLQAQKPHSGSGAVVYTHVATSANTTAYWTALDNKATNNNPNAFLIVMPNRGGSNAGHVVDNHPIAVWYDAMMGKWAIFNQDKAGMPVGAAFNVYAIPQATQSASNQSMAIIDVASSSNSKGNWTYIDSPVTNGNPNAFVNATVNWEAGGVYDPHPLGAFYDTVEQKWAIFNEGSIDPIPQGAAFNLLVDAPIIGGVLLHKSAASNTSGNHTSITDSSMNNSAQAIVFATPNFNPQGQGGTYETHNLGVFYQNGAWAIFNEDNAAMPTGASFDVLAVNPTPTA